MCNKLALVVISVLLIGILAACTPGFASLGAPVGLAAQQPTATQQQQTTPASRTINVAGNGKVMLDPDIAYINIGVHTENEEAGQALEENNTQVQKVIDALKAAGVADRDLQTSNFNIYPSQQYGPNGEVLETKYVVDNTVYVTVRNLNNLGTLLETVVSSGANSINGIQFDVADKTKALSDARKQALDNARTLAEETATAAGVDLGEIQSINIYTNTGPIPLYDSFGRGGGLGAPEASQVPIVSGQISVTADVNVVYAIE